MLGPVLRPGFKYQIRIVENTVTTDAKDGEGEGFDCNVIMMISLQRGIWEAPLNCYIAK